LETNILATSDLQATTLSAEVLDSRQSLTLPGDITVDTLTTPSLTASRLIGQTGTATDLADDPSLTASALRVTGDATVTTLVTSEGTTNDATVTTLVAPNVVNLAPQSVNEYTSGVTVVPWPADAIYARVEATGGGGGGGGTSSTVNSSGGGGSSGYARFFITPDLVAQYTGLTIDIGTAGAAGAVDADGSTGGTTTITLNGAPSQVVCTCPGGGGGLTGANGAAGGAAGAAPTLTLVQGHSEPGTVGYNSWFFTAPEVTNFNGGLGGASKLGNGGEGATPNSNPGFPAVAGVSGGGGGGGARDSSGPAFPAAGGSGKCIIVWYNGFV